MGALNTRVRRFDDGGLQPDVDLSQSDLPLPPPAPPPVAAPPPAPAGTPSMLFPGAPLPAPPPPAPAIQTKAAPPAERAYDDNIELDKARREDETVLNDETNVLSHYGDHRFVVPQPKMEDFDYTKDPEHEQLSQAQQYIQEQGRGQKPADVARAISMVKSKQAALVKRYNDKYKDEFTKWRLSEAEQFKGAEGDKLSGKGLETEWGSVDDLRSTAETTLKAVTTPQGKMEYAGHPVATMSPGNFKESATRIGQLNNLPPDRAVEILTHLAGPNGSFNGRQGAAAANYKVVARDVVGNIWLDTEDGKIRVTPNTFKQINDARVKGYRAIQKLEKETKK